LLRGLVFFQQRKKRTALNNNNKKKRGENTMGMICSTLRFLVILLLIGGLIFVMLTWLGYGKPDVWTSKECIKDSSTMDALKDYWSD
jgi:hypothetical protein